MSKKQQSESTGSMGTGMDAQTEAGEFTGEFTVPSPVLAEGKKATKLKKPKPGEIRFRLATFEVEGTAPLVVRRFSSKIKESLLRKMEMGKSAGSRKTREAVDKEALYNEARYRSPEGWDGINASGFRLALISACRLMGYKMTLAKLSLFIEADGRDKEEPQIPLVRIYGEPVMQEDMARVETGQPYVTVRPAYHEWKMRVRVQWDSDQFSETDVKNLMTRVGIQVGLCEGRPDSKKSAGMGWGLFRAKLVKVEDVKFED